ncbi:MAG: ABC transporter ATP-binding protein [Actinomycetota bacterium]
MRAELAASCSDVVKIYLSAAGHVRALDAVDAEFPERAVTAVLGPSGSGKSSLLKILAGLERATSGQVEVGGAWFSGLGPGGLRRARRALVGYVFQRPSDNLISYLTVIEHLRLAARLRSREGGGEVDELLEVLGLGPRATSLPRHLSGGEQQRVAFAQAVIGAPAVVIADEPTAELDGRSARALVDVIGDLARRGSAIIVATHDVAVSQGAQRRIVLDHGSVTEAGR